jgi:hypothetical protein
MGSPSLHIRSFQLWQVRLSACFIKASPLPRIWSACADRIPVMARAFTSSFLIALRSPPESGVG